MISNFKKLLLSAIGIATLTLLGAGNAQANLLLNGGFEEPLNGIAAPGWITKLDGTYWQWSSTPTLVYEGDHAARRVLYSGQKAGTSLVFTGNKYDGVNANETYRFEFSLRTSGQSGKFNVAGVISFFDASDNLLGSFQTEALQPGVWTRMRVDAVAPENAVKFQISAVISTLSDLTGNAYADLDSFSVDVIPEPSGVALLGLAGAAIILAGRFRLGRRSVTVL